MDIDSTPSEHHLSLRTADFGTLSEALDYAALGETGFNFYDSRARLRHTLPYAELRQRARHLASRLLGLGLSRGDRVAVVAETDPAFPVLFFACQYAGLVPVPLPISLNLGGREAYVEQLRGLLDVARPAVAVASDELSTFLREASDDTPGLQVFSHDDLELLAEGDVDLEPSGPGDVAYLQFTSGSTSFPRGVVIRQGAVMNNLRGIVRDGLRVRAGDRCASWLPFYHDMGLVGFMLGPVASQLSVDYLASRDFAMRPVSWLTLISRNGGTIAFAPPIAFQLCARRLRHGPPEGLDLRSWRVAGIGAEPISPESLEEFVRSAGPAGFDPDAFLPCYGLAESTLAVTFSSLGDGVRVEQVDADVLAEEGVSRPVGPSTRSATSVVNCGQPLPGHALRIVDDEGVPQGMRTVGRILLRGPSVMSGYFDDPESTASVLDPDGWLDTGDRGYLTDDGLYVIGRTKDVIIVNGRNIWPQDLEQIVEREESVRPGDVSAFPVPGPNGGEVAAVTVQCRLGDPAEREALVRRIRSSIYEHVGVRCIVELVPPGTLPKTSSGKLSRSEARKGFLERAGSREGDVVLETSDG